MGSSTMSTLLGRGRSPPQKLLSTHRATQSLNKHTDIYKSSGIRTHDPSTWAGEDNSCLRLRGRCHRRIANLTCHDYWNDMEPNDKRIWMLGWIGNYGEETVAYCKSVREQDIINKQTPWSESASELYRPSDRRLSANWLPNFADRGCHVVSVADPYGRILGF
jgi:hypothetical protein